MLWPKVGPGSKGARVPLAWSGARVLTMTKSYLLWGAKGVGLQVALPGWPSVHAAKAPKPQATAMHRWLEDCLCWVSRGAGCEQGAAYLLMSCADRPPAARAQKSGGGANVQTSVREILAEVDKDNDGRIDYQEFCDMMRGQVRSRASDWWLRLTWLAFWYHRLGQPDKRQIRTFREELSCMTFAELRCCM